MSEQKVEPMTFEAKQDIITLLVDWSEILQETYRREGLLLEKGEAINRAWVLLIRGASKSDMDKPAVNPLDMVDFSSERERFCEHGVYEHLCHSCARS